MATERRVTATPLTCSRDASSTNITEHSNLDIVNRGNGALTHIGHDNRNNQDAVANVENSIQPDPRESSEILSELRQAPAHYDSSLRKQAQECMQETRVDILTAVYKWVDGVDNPPIFWLNGPAGTGKSTIAHTVAEECRRRGRLGASFFFAHAHAECSDPDLFFTTIAYQLSNFDPELRQHIIQGVRAQSLPQYASVPTQFEQFILGPLRKFFNDPAREPIIVVVDAFDECNDARKASEILQLLSTKIRSSPLLFKLFITSRPEPEILSILHPDIDRISRSLDLLRDVGASSTDKDIKHFIQFHLRRIGKEYRLPSWPREGDVQILTQQAGGLFIFAHTSIALIGDKGAMDPESQLAMLINIGSIGTPTFNLNVLYSRILQKAMLDTTGISIQEYGIVVIHAIVGLRAPLALSAIERLLGLDRGVVRATLNRLRSIFIVPDNDEDTAQVIHPSFARYITDEDSCPERFFMSHQHLHGRLAKYCLKQMKHHLKQNICNFKDFAVVETPIVDKNTNSLQILSAQLKYSCENFAAHVFSADWQDDELYDMVAEWANQYLPYWLEVLVLSGSIRDALPSLRLLSNFCKVVSAFHVEPPAYSYDQPADIPHSRKQAQILKAAAKPKVQKSFLPQWLLPKQLEDRKTAHEPEQGPTEYPQQLPQLLADATRMVSESYDDIRRFPYQIYASCFTFCPLDSPLSKQYSQFSDFRVLAGKRQDWGPLLQAFRDPDSDAVGLTFSPDGMILASCSSVGRILLWNLVTGENRLLTSHSLQSHPTFSFSPDGKYIAADGNVYEVATGKQVVAPGNCSAFSPDGLYIALGCVDGAIMLHDMQTPCLSLLGEPFGHRHMITMVAFFDNGFLASVSLDHTICVWNCSSQDMIKQIPCLDPSGHLAFSPNGTYVAAFYKYFFLGRRYEPYVWVSDIQTESMTTIFSPSGNSIFSCKHVEVDAARWLEATQTPSRLLNYGVGRDLTAISFTPDEQYLFVGDEQGLIRSWRIPKEGQSADSLDFEYKAHFGTVRAIAFSRGGKYFASASIDGSICVWDYTSVEFHKQDLTSTSMLSGQTVAFAPDGQTVAIGSGNTVSKIDATTGYSIFYREGAPYRGNHRLIFSPDGKYLASNCHRELLFWDTGNPYALNRRQIPLKSTGCIIAQAFSQDATHYAVRFLNADLWVHDLRSGKSRQMMHPNRKPYFEKLRFSHNNKYLVSYFRDMCVFNVRKGKETRLCLPVRSHVLNCAFSPCGQTIAVAHDSGLDASEYLVKKPTVRTIHRQNGYCSVEFSPDGNYILAAPDGRLELNLLRPDTLETLYTIEMWSRQHVDQAIREFRRTGRLLNHRSEWEDFPYFLDKDGWVITASSKRLCRLPMANRGEVYDVNGNRIVVVSPKGKVTVIQFGPSPICIPTPSVGSFCYDLYSMVG